MNFKTYTLLINHKSINMTKGGKNRKIQEKKNAIVLKNQPDEKLKVPEKCPCCCDDGKFFYDSDVTKIVDENDCNYVHKKDMKMYYRYNYMGDDNYEYYHYGDMFTMNTPDDVYYVGMTTLRLEKATVYSKGTEYTIQGDIYSLKDDLYVYDDNVYKINRDAKTFDMVGAMEGLLHGGDWCYKYEDVVYRFRGEYIPV